MSVPGEVVFPRQANPPGPGARPHTLTGVWGYPFHDFNPSHAAEDLAKFLGRPCDDAFRTLADQHLATIVTMVKSYTRGNGFDSYDLPHPELVSVILPATARLVVNAAQVESEQTEGYAVRGSFNGFTLAELFVLNRFRTRAG